MKRFLAFLLALISLLSSVPALAAEKQSTYSVGSQSYCLQTGYYYAYGGQDDEHSTYLPYYYSDGYFFDSARVYNEHLATMSLNMSISVLQNNRHLASEYVHGATRQLMVDIGCEEASVFVSEDDLKTPEADTIGYMIGQKSLKTAAGTDTGNTLVILAIRGEGESAEWISNLTFGTVGEAQGYAEAATKVMSGLMDYLSAYGLDTRIIESNNVKLWITGFSRGGTVTNLVSKRVADHFIAARQETLSENQFDRNLFSYSWAAVKAGIDDGSAGSYKSIHNINNYADITSYMAPGCSGFGFARYGTDHSFPSADAAAYEDERAKMLVQYELIDPAEQRDYIEESKDSFCLYYIDLSGKTYEITKNIIAVVKNKHPNEVENRYSFSCNHYTGDFLDLFVRQLITWGNMDRQKYAAQKITLNGKTYTTVEDALRSVGSILFGATEEQRDAAAACLKNIDVSYVDLIVSDISSILKWNSISEASREKLIRKYWSYIADAGVPEALGVTPEQKQQLESAWFTGLCTLIPIILLDKDSPLNSYCSTVPALNVYAGSSSKYRAVMTCSLVENVEKSVVNMHSDVYLAWARSYDSFYQDDDWYYFTEKKDGVPVPVKPITQITAAKAVIDGVVLSAEPLNPTPLEISSEHVLSLDLPGAGETLFYSVCDALDNSKVLVPRTLYSAPTVLPGECAADHPYEITVTALSHGIISEASYFVKKVDTRKAERFYLLQARFKTVKGFDTLEVKDGKCFLQLCLCETAQETDSSFYAKGTDRVTVCAAVYDRDGRLVCFALSTDSVNTFCNETIPQEIAVDYFQNCTYRLFIADASTLKPLCPGFSLQPGVHAG